MVDRVKSCYVGITGWIRTFEEVVWSAVLPNAGKLDPSASEDLLGHYRELEKVVDAALTYTLSCPTATLDSRGRIPDYVHRLADHAKYVYAIGSRDIAAMQYNLAELADAGRLDHEVQKGLQWDHCLPMWETLYHGTICAVRDGRTWDWGWDWSDNTYSDGRQVMAQVRVKNWYQLDCTWPYNKDMCGDGAINEHPRGTLCKVYPVVDPDKDHHQHHPTIEIDPEELINQLGPARPDFVVDVDAEAALDAAMLELSNELANEETPS
jgi:hypothetical protein